MGLSAGERRKKTHHVSILQHVIRLGVKPVDNDDPGDVIRKLEFLDYVVHGLLSFEGRRERERPATRGKKVPEVRE